MAALPQPYPALADHETVLVWDCIPVFDEEEADAAAQEAGFADAEAQAQAEAEAA